MGTDHGADLEKGRDILKSASHMLEFNPLSKYFTPQAVQLPFFSKGIDAKDEDEDCGQDDIGAEERYRLEQLTRRVMKLVKIIDYDKEGKDQNQKDRYKPELPVLLLQSLDALHRVGDFINFFDGPLPG